MRAHSRLLLLILTLLAAAGCNPSYTGTFVDPSGTAWVNIRPKGEIRNMMGDTLHYTVGETTAEGTTLHVTDGAAYKAEWRVTADGKELHGATSPAKVVFRRK